MRTFGCDVCGIPDTPPPDTIPTWPDLPEPFPGRYYDRDGQPITFGQWVWIMEQAPGYRIVRHTHLPGGGKVSTVLLGIDHNFDGDGEPLIFETMVFDLDGWDDWQERYATEQEAVQRHDAIVAEIAGEVD